MKLQDRISAHKNELGFVEKAALYKEVFNTPQGQKVLADILNRLCNVDGPVFHENPVALAFNAARRDVGLEIARMVWLEVVKEKAPEVKA